MRISCGLFAFIALAMQPSLAEAKSKQVWIADALRAHSATVDLQIRFLDCGTNPTCAPLTLHCGSQYKRFFALTYFGERISYEWMRHIVSFGHSYPSFHLGADNVAFRINEIGRIGDEIVGTSWQVEFELHPTSRPEGDPTSLLFEFLESEEPIEMNLSGLLDRSLEPHAVLFPPDQEDNALRRDFVSACQALM